MQNDQPPFSVPPPPDATPPAYAVPPQPDTPPQSGYGVPPSQPSYGTPPQSGYGVPPTQPGYGTPPSYGVPQQPGYTYGTPPLQPGAPGPMYLAPQTSGMALASMIMGITTFVGLGIIGSILALVFANLGEKEIQNSGGRLTGLGYVQAGRIMGWIGVGLTALVIIGLILFFVVFANFAVNNLPVIPTDTPTPFGQ